MNKILIVLFILINVYCFVVVGVDKNLAINGAYGTPQNISHRISEVRIVTYSALGGAIGTYVGFKVFNHKTSFRKAYFRHSITVLIVQNVIFWFSLFMLFNRCKKSKIKKKQKIAEEEPKEII